MSRLVGRVIPGIYEIFGFMLLLAVSVVRAIAEFGDPPRQETEGEGCDEATRRKILYDEARGTGREFRERMEKLPPRVVIDGIAELKKAFPKIRSLESKSLSLNPGFDVVVVFEGGPSALALVEVGLTPFDILNCAAGVGSFLKGSLRFEVASGCVVAREAAGLAGPLMFEGEKASRFQIEILWPIMNNLSTGVAWGGIAGQRGAIIAKQRAEAMLRWLLQISKYQSDIFTGVNTRWEGEVVKFSIPGS